MIVAIFWAIGYLIWKYTKVEVVETTKTSLPIPMLIVIVLLIAIVVFGGFIILLISWWEKIKEDKLSFYTFLPIYILMLGTIIISKLGLHKVKVLLEFNVQQFIQDLTNYNQSLTVLIFILVSGIVVGAIGYVFEQ
jgi:hypothetical protein